MKRQLVIALGLMASIFLASCQKDDEANGEKAIVDLRNITFHLTDEPFGAEVQSSRAGFLPQPATQAVDLGNGLTAEVSAENDAPDASAVTRAPMSDGKYYVYAVDIHGNRIKGDAKAVSGTMTSGVFKIDEGASLNLPAGKYTFVCYNQYVNDDGDKLTFTDDQRARVGYTEHTLAAAPHMQSVTFAMKRQVARVRFKITAYTTQAPNISAKLTSTVDQPASVSYTGLIENPQSVNAAIDHACAFPATTEDKNILAYDFFTPYYNYMASVDGAKLKLSFSAGEVYGKSLAGKEFVLSNLGKLDANGSYTVRIKLMTNPLYLYQDGTIGIYEERDTRTPIGIMITERTKPIADAKDDEEGTGLAIALKNAEVDGNTIFTMAPNASSNSNTEYAPYEDPDASFPFNDKKGYFWTWEREGSTNHVIKAEEKDDHPGFYAAGHYNPGVKVTGQNVSKWFVPGVGQVILALRKLKVVDMKLSDWESSSGMNAAIEQSRIDEAFQKQAFERVGGVSYLEDYGYYTSTEHGTAAEFFALQPGYYSLIFAYRRFYEDNTIRPYVHF